MATWTFTYKGLNFDPPLYHETVFGWPAMMMRLDAELRERGEEWFSDGKSKVLDDYRLNA